MDDQNKVIIDGANFNRTLPEWASEETLSRLERLIGNTTKQHSKTLDSIYNTMRAMSKKDNAQIIKEINDSNKQDKKSSSDLLKALGDINNNIKALKQTNNSNSSSNSTSNSENDNSSKQIKKSLDDGFSTLSNDNSDLIKTILDGNEDIDYYLKTIEKKSSQSEYYVERIYELLQIMQGSGSSTNKQSSANNKNKNNTKNRNDNPQESNGGRNEILESINEKMDMQNRIQNMILDKTVSNSQLKNIMANSTADLSSSYRDASSNTTSGIGSVISQYIDKNVNGEGGSDNDSGGMAATIAALGGTLAKTIMKTIQMTPWGKALTLASAGFTAASKTFEYAYEAQDDFMGLYNQGFGFGQLQEQLQERDEGDRLDGIMLRQIITDSGVTLENASKLLENNARTINEMGFGNFFGEIGAILGDPRKQDSITQQLGMTREVVAGIVTDFYSMSRDINGLTRDMDTLERTSMAKRFVNNVRDMSLALGVSTDTIRNSIKEFRDSESFRASATFMNTEQSTNLGNFGGLLEASGLPENIKNALTASITNIQGVASQEVADTFGRMPQMYQAIMGFQDELRNVPNASRDEQQELFNNIILKMNDTLQENQEFNRVLMSTGGKDLLSSFQSVEGIAQQIQQNQGSNDAVEFTETSNMQQLREQLKNMGMLVSARTENVFATAANSDVGREAIGALLDSDEIMKEAQLSVLDTLNDIADSLGSSGMIVSVLEKIRYVATKIADIASFGDEELDKGDSELFAKRFIDVLGNNNVSSIFDVNKEDKTVSLKKGIGSDDITKYFTTLYENAETEEQRKSIAGTVETLTHSIDNFAGTIDSDVTDKVKNASNSFFNNITRNMDGQEFLDYKGLQSDPERAAEYAMNTGDLFGDSNTAISDISLNDEVKRTINDITTQAKARATMSENNKNLPSNSNKKRIDTSFINDLFNDRIVDTTGVDRLMEKLENNSNTNRQKNTRKNNVSPYENDASQVNLGNIEQLMANIENISNTNRPTNTERNNVSPYENDASQVNLGNIEQLMANINRERNDIQRRGNISPSSENDSNTGIDEGQTRSIRNKVIADVEQQRANQELENNERDLASNSNNPQATQNVNEYNFPNNYENSNNDEQLASLGGISGDINRMVETQNKTNNLLSRFLDSRV